MKTITFTDEQNALMETIDLIERARKRTNLQSIRDPLQSAKLAAEEHLGQLLVRLARYAPETYEI